MSKLGVKMEAEILEQPALLAQNVNRFENELSSFRHVAMPQLFVLVARGSSNNAAIYARYLFEVGLGVPAMIAAPSISTQFGITTRYPPAIGIGISQSGAAPDVANVLSVINANGYQTLAITNTPASLVEMHAKTLLHLGAGIERSVPATKTYTLSLLALLQLARAMGADYPDPSPYLPNEAWLTIARETAQAHVEAVRVGEVGFVVGRGFSFSSACEISLKLIECSLIPCHSYSVADFQHGPRVLARANSWLISLEGQLAPNVIRNAKVLLPPEPHSNIPPVMRPLWLVIYGQWLALEMARVKGIDPDDPDGLSKITKTL
jgi:glucosamine--fructose-6-phosphate aminotransferase (isomerizing)